MDKYIAFRLDTHLYSQFRERIKKEHLNAASILRNLLEKWVCNNTPDKFQEA